MKELKAFTREAVRDLLLPVRQQREDAAPPPPRPAAVYGPRLPEMGAAAKKAPYILHQIVTGRDSQKPGEPPQAAALVRTVFCVYHPDEQEGGLALLNLMEQLRTALLERAVVGRRFCLDLGAGLETLVYPDDGEHPTTPYYLGEMVSSWRLPPVRRLDAARIASGMPPWDPSARHLEEIIGQKGSD